MARNRTFGRTVVLAIAIPLLAYGCATHHAIATTQPSVSYDGSPKFMPIEGTSTSYAANSREEIVQSAGMYYLRYEGSWLASEDPDGPWRITSVPVEVAEIICSRVGPYDRSGNYQLCTMPNPVPLDFKDFHAN